MTIMTSREFNQQTSLAQKYAQTAPVIITHRGKPAFVLLKYEDYQIPKQPFKSALDVLTPPLEIAKALEFIDLPLQPRSKAQRPPVDFGDD